MKVLLFFFLLAFSKIPLEALYCFDGDPSYEECPNMYIEDARLEGGYYIGDFISIDKGYGMFGVVKPLSVSDDYRPFIDAKAYVLNDHRWAANGGIGYRARVSEYSVAGVNIYYDYRRGECKNSFHQVGLGFEWLSDFVDVQVNGYLPVGDTKQEYRKCVEFAYSGLDASIGTSLYSYRGFNFYAMAGAYYFSHPSQQQFFGGFGGFELDWRSLIIFKVRFSNDRIYSKNAQGIFILSIPLDLFYVAGPNECYCGWDMLSLPVRRIGMILLDNYSKKKCKNHRAFNCCGSY